MKTLKQDREEQVVRDQNSENIALFHSWITKHPEIRPCEATFKAFEEYIQDFHTDPLTEADFEFALSNIPEGRLVKQRVPSREEVVTLENARRKSMTLSELKTLARQETPAPTAPTLPMEFEGHNIADATSLKQLVKADYPSFKRLSNKFGNQLINQRLGVKPTAKVGVSVRLPL